MPRSEARISNTLLLTFWLSSGLFPMTNSNSKQSASLTWSLSSAYAATCIRLTAFMKRLSETYTGGSHLSCR